MKKIIFTICMCVLCSNLSAQTKDYYSKLNQYDTILVNKTRYCTSRFPSEEINGRISNCMLFITNLNNRALLKQLFKATYKETGEPLGALDADHIYRYSLFTKTTAAKELLEQVFSNEERLSLTSPNNFLRLELYVDKYGNVDGVGFCFEYTDDDKTILAIPPEKLAAIESLLIEKLKIDFNDDKEEVSTSKQRMHVKKYIYEKCDFVYLRTHLHVSFNGNDIVVTCGRNTR